MVNDFKTTLEEVLDYSKKRQKPLPVHIAVIMDGNGRWAKKHNKPRLYGHREGMKTVRRIIEGAAEAKIKYLSLYAFSTENWARPKEEIKGLFSLLEHFCQKETKNLVNNGIRVFFIGRLYQFSEKLRTLLKNVEEKTAKGKNLNVAIALNYGGQQEIVDAVKKIVKSNINADELNEKNFYNFLYNSELPPVDLLIRTSGEYRISNFLLYQCAYAEFYFTKTLWPEFTKEEFFFAIKDFLNRERRFGGINKNYE